MGTSVASRGEQKQQQEQQSLSLIVQQEATGLVFACRSLAIGTAAAPVIRLNFHPTCTASAQQRHQQQLSKSKQQQQQQQQRTLNRSVAGIVVLFAAWQDEASCSQAVSH
jgi:hypothetical protein